MQTQDVTASPDRATGEEKDPRNNPITQSATNIDNSGGDPPPTGTARPPLDGPPGGGGEHK
jgi:hypothetical protein